MRARILSTTTGRTIYATAVISREGKQEWKSDEGAYLGEVGKLPEYYRIQRIVDEKRKE